MKYNFRIVAIAIVVVAISVPSSFALEGAAPKMATAAERLLAALTPEQKALAKEQADIYAPKIEDENGQ